MLEIPSGPVPAFVSVTVCAVLLCPINVCGKFKLLRDTTGMPALALLPFTYNGGVPAALLVTVIVPPSLPAKVGVKASVKLQNAPTARELGLVGQLFVSTKSDEPLQAMLLMSKGAN